MARRASSLAVCLVTVVSGLPANAGATVIRFFSPSQQYTAGTAGATTDTFLTCGYSIQRTADKYWAPYVGGTPTGRFFSVNWPAGVQAQAVTAGPNPGSAQIVLRRQDGQVFDLLTLRIKLLANTAGAGASLEIMPLLDGNDGLPDPLALDATGYGGMSFDYTPALSGFDTYKLSLYVDFAITGATLVSETPTVPEPAWMAGVLLPLPLLRRRNCS